MREFERSTPEAQGIRTRDIIELVKRLKEHGLPMHSLLIERHGILVTELYYAPFEKDTLHRMYSETKSFVSMAIGKLESEGKLKLQDRICDYFPEYLPGVVHPWLEELTIEDMLKMETCYDMTVYTKADPKACWTREFFRAVPTHRPGTVFQYDTSGTHTMGALVKKLSGLDPLEYLKQNGFDEIGFSDESFILPRPDGETRNGSGLMALPSDMLKTARLLLDDGVDRKTGREILPKEYLKKATAVQTPIAPNTHDAKGYGYQFWIRDENCFMMLGMGSNDTMMLRDKDLAVVYTCDSQGIPAATFDIQRLILEILVGNMSDEPFPEDPEALEELETLAETLSIPVTGNTVTEHWQDRVNGRTFGIAANKHDFQEFTLRFGTDGEGVMEFVRCGKHFRLPFGIGKNVCGTFPGYDLQTYTSAGWLREDTFFINAQVLDYELSSEQFKFVFLPDGGLTVMMKKNEEVLMNEFNGLLNGQLIR
ncbi:MAG: serine hydrolase [Lachnospiraceae bacterium]|nr:serine hydrolase [Lachnospiraceae bacterium]